MAEELRLRSLSIDQDAEALARMWNESDDQWPGSFTGGVPFTAERMRRWYEEEAALDVLVWATEAGNLAGYCSFQKMAEEEGVGYIAYLNVHPGYQKRSLGRKFLQTYVERCIQLGFHRLDLHTWPGNLKSVPLYKKTGFFWMPDTNVWMLNFMPAILQMPAARPYFEKHDWYATFQRKLEQREDDERWHGMKVFTYHWESEGADGDALTVWADREGRSITAIETDTFFAAAIPENIAPPKGLPAPIHWEIRNKGDQPLPVSLVARGTEQMKLDYRDNLVVAPGETLERWAAVEIAAQMPKVPKNRPAPKIQTLLIIGGQLVELGAGLRPEPAIIVETLPKRFTMAPGASRKVHVQLRNALHLPIQAQVSLIAPEGLAVDQSGDAVELAPYGQSGLPITVQAQAPGAYPLQAVVSFSVNGQQGEAAPQTLPIVALYPGQVMAHETEEGVQLDTAEIAYEVRREGGGLNLLLPEADQSIGAVNAELGPPYEPPDCMFRAAELSWRRQDGEIVAESRIASQRFPGLTLVREYHFTGGPLVRIVYRVLNRSDRAQRPELIQLFQSNGHDAHLVIPLRDGLLESYNRNFPRGDQEVPRKSEEYAERWLASERKDMTLGFLWGEAIDEARLEWALSLHRPAFDCPPHGWSAPFETCLYAGPGSWRNVQKSYLQWSGQGKTTLAAPEPIVKLSWDPAVPLTESAALDATLRLENRRQQSLQGSLRLQAPTGWSVEPSEIAFADVDRWHPFTAEVKLRQAETQPGGYALQAHLSTRISDTQQPLPFVRLGDGRSVIVARGEQEGQPLWTVDNGETRFDIAPEFSATVVGWRTADGVNHLESPFPEVKTKSWLAPWYGGLSPMLRIAEDRHIPGKLYQEGFQAEPVSVQDAQGMTWQGLRVKSMLQREPLRGLRVEVDYLTVGGSSLLKTVYRVVNETTAARRAFGGWMSYWQPDGEFRQNVLRAEEWESKRTDFVDTWVRDQYWGSITNPATGRTVIAVSAQPIVALVEEGQDSTMLVVEDELLVPPAGVLERVVYFALAPDFPSARAYCCLK